VISEDECREAAREALESLPGWVREQIGEVALVVVDSHPGGRMGLDDPVGGIQRIVIFRDANPTAEEVRKTVLHEVGHYFGMAEDQLEELGFG
jgi:predicted Zn-dependent protease with MMP-like domain